MKNRFSKKFLILVIGLLVGGLFSLMAPTGTATAAKSAAEFCSSEYPPQGTPEYNACQAGWIYGNTNQDNSFELGGAMYTTSDGAFCSASAMNFDSAKQTQACIDGAKDGFKGPTPSTGGGSGGGSSTTTVPKPPSSNKAGVFCHQSYSNDKSKYDACVKGYNTSGYMPAVCGKEVHYIVCSKGWVGKLKAEKKVANSTNAESIWDTCKRVTEQLPENSPYLSGDSVGNGDQSTACIAGFIRSELSPPTTKANFCAQAGSAKPACEMGWDIRNKGEANVVANTSGGSAAEADLCHQDNNILNWAVCGLIDLMQATTEKIDEFIMKQLLVGSIDGSNNTTAVFCENPGDTGSCAAFKSAWSSIRNIALGLMVLVGLVILIANMVGTELVSSYMIKKTLPRILIATIAISLSWELMRFLVTLTNDVGIGIKDIIIQPFANADLEGFSTGGAVVIESALIFGAGAAVFTGLFVLGVGGVLALMATAFLAIIIVLVVLTIRQVLIITLVVVAPLALVAYILPNTNGYFKLWWSLLSKALLMFPIIMALIAFGHVFALISIQNAEGNGLGAFIGFLAYIAPYFFIPFTFKWAGGAISTLGGMMNDRSRGTFDRLRKYRGNKAQQNWGATQSGHRFNKNLPGRLGKTAGRLNDFGSSATSPGATTLMKIDSLSRKKYIPGSGTNLSAGIQSQWGQGKMKQTSKLADHLNQVGMTADALGALGSLKSFTTKDILGAAENLEANGHSLAASQLKSNALFLSQNLHKDAEMGKADVAGAAVLAKASQGFASQDEIAHVANTMESKGGVGAAQAEAFVTSAQLANMRAGNIASKPTYGVVRGKNGKWLGTGTSTTGDGDVAPNAQVSGEQAFHQARNLLSRGPQDLQGAKKNGLNELSAGIQAVMGREHDFDENGMTDLDFGDGNVLKLHKSEVEKTAAMLGSAAHGPYSSASPNVAAALDKLVPTAEMGSVAREAYERGAQQKIDPNVINPQGPQEPPQPLSGASG